MRSGWNAVEGGFEGSTKSNCRKAFKTLLEKVIRPRSFSVIASGSRKAAFEDFSSALRKHPEDFIVLLVDAEAAVSTGATTWNHLNQRQGDQWLRPKGAGDDQAHLMVQVMEAWFLADQGALAAYYGQGFLRSSLPGRINVEKVEKKRVFEALRTASKHTQKGRYHKTRHGFDLLELISPGLVRRASSHADAFFSALERVSDQ